MVGVMGKVNCFIEGYAELCDEYVVEEDEECG